MMDVLKAMREGGDFEQLVFCQDKETGLKAIIAIHSLALGPAVGGTRMWNYESEDAALYDVLRLSKGMSYKASLAGLNWGGGKAVIVGDPKTAKSPALLKRFGQMVDRLAGNYVTAKDVGIGGADLMKVREGTQHVLGIDGLAGSSGDPSEATAWGVYHGMKASAEAAWGSSQLAGKTISIQGLGSVSRFLLKHLHQEGAKLIGCDVDAEAIAKARALGPIEIVEPNSIYDQKADIFSPSALGAVINAKTLPRLKVKVVAGAANNQLENPADGDELHRRGMVYAPDYAINAGGLMNIYHERPEYKGYDKARALKHVEQVGDVVRRILERSKASQTPSYIVADQMAEERIRAARKSSL